MAWKHPKGVHLSAATRAKISARLRGRHLSAAARAHISAGLKGHSKGWQVHHGWTVHHGWPHKPGGHLSPTTKARISAKLKGRHLSPAARQKLSPGLRVRHVSARHGMSTGRYGRRLSEAARLRLSLRLRGHPHHRTLTRKPPKPRRVDQRSPYRLISTTTHRHISKIRLTPRRRLHRPVIHRKARAHRVWRRRR